MFGKKKITKRMLATMISMLVLGVMLAGCGEVTTTANYNAVVATNTPAVATTSIRLPTVTPMPTAAMPTVTPIPTPTAIPTTTSATVADTTLPSVTPTTDATTTTIATTIAPTATSQPQPTLQKPIVADTRQPAPTTEPLPTPTSQPTSASSGQPKVSLTAEQAIAIAKKALDDGGNGLPGQVKFTSYFPDSPGTKTTNINPCKAQPKNDVANPCASKVLGTTEAKLNGNIWNISLSLAWTVELPGGPKMSQATHTWRLAVSPQGEATLLSEEGANVPAF